MLSDDDSVAITNSESEDVASPGLVTDLEEWQDYHSEELVTLWHALQDRIATLGVYVLDECHISDFTDFCFRYSSGRKPPC